MSKSKHKYESSGTPFCDFLGVGGDTTCNWVAIWGPGARKIWATARRAATQNGHKDKHCDPKWTQSIL